MPHHDPAIPLPDRACGDCHMCCKVIPVAEAGKSGFELCGRARHDGCATYLTRPDACREFFCMWRLDASLDDAWKPSVAGFVLHDPAPFALLVSCDADQPDAWRREPYGSRIRHWAADIQRRGLLMAARAGARTILLLRDREIALDA